ncbi:MAG: flippase [Tildeniella nuda ZEHNDER 1965/U140]|jgi:PST family polysaccharide transporter|nr:flippase [Tildeniella nuda ZEHNDER 1965/U140]
MNQAWIQFLPSSLRSKLDGRYTLQKILSNAGWLFADRILRMGIGLFVGVWVARYLGPEQFGLFNYAIAFVVLLTPFATLGLDNIVVRDLVCNPDCRAVTLGTAFVLKLCGATITALVTLGAITLLRPDHSLDQWLVGIIAAGLLFQAFDAIDFWFQSQMQSKYTVYAKNLAFVLFAVVRITLIQAHAPLIAFAWAGLTETAIGAVGLVIGYRATGNDLGDWKISIFRVKSLLQDSWALILSSIAILIYMKIDQIMLGEMLGNKAVGIYAAATKISEVWYFIPMAIASSVSPAIMGAKAIGQDAYMQKLQSTFDLMVVLAFVVSLPISFLSPVIISILYGEGYSSSSQVLSIHIWASLFVFLGVGREIWIVSEGMMLISFLTTLLGAIVNVTLNLFLIPIYQEIGAAIATLVAYAIPGYLICLAYTPLQGIGRLMTNALLLKWLYKKNLNH